MKKYLFYSLTSSGDKENIRYIGVTSRNLSKRLTGHKYCANHKEKRGLPVHKWMYAEYQKGNEIIITQIHECDENEWENTEIELIKQYKEKGYKLLNLDKGGKGVINAEKRAINSIERSVAAKRVKIIQLTTDGKFVAEHRSITDAAKLFNGTLENIENNLKHSTKSAFGYLWIYKSEYDPNKKYSLNYDWNSKNVYQFDLNYNLIKKWKSKKDIVKFYEGSYNGLSCAIINKKEYKNYFWSYSNKINKNLYKQPYNYEVYKDNILINRVRFQKEVSKIINLTKNNIIKKLKINSSFIYNGYYVKKLN